MRNLLKLIWAVVAKDLQLMELGHQIMPRTHFFMVLASILVEHTLIRDGGGTVLENMSQKFGESNSPQVKMSTNLVIYNGNSQSMDEETSVKRIAEADKLARCVRASVIPDTWIVSSVTLCRLVPH